MTDHLHIITGGPSSGKSSLVAALAAEGFAHMPEAGRAIIQDQQAVGGHALPWDDRAAFAELMLGWELRSHREARAMARPVIFDRGVPDVIGYLRLCDLPVPDHVRRAGELFRYNPTVFIAPYWAEIFTQDAERRQEPAEAEATFHAMRQAYAELGYDLIELPRGPLAMRVDFVRRHVG